MLIAPVAGKLSRKNPPLVTIGLILLNCLVFFTLQSGDATHLAEAFSYYDESGLAELEFRYYLEYLGNDGTGMEPKVMWSRDPAGQMVRRKLYSQMMSDKQFNRQLLDQAIITPDSPDFERWQTLHASFQEKMNRVSSYRYGYIPAEPQVADTISYMFFHGGFLHLLGNMIFLWLAGCMVEAVCNRWAYLGGYLITGIVGVICYGLVYRTSHLPLVGASGCISGLMGAYCVLFGLKKVKVFYSIGFYFNYARLPAIVLLPFWLGTEVFQLLKLGEISNVAYVVHIAGIVIGSILAVGYKRFVGAEELHDSEEEQQSRIDHCLEQGLTLKSQLNLKQAREKFEEVLAQNPQHLEALRNLFAIEVLSPTVESLGRTTNRLLSLLGKQSDHGEMLEVYSEYVKQTNNRDLAPDLLVRIHHLLLQKKELKEAVAIISELLKKHPQLPQLPAAILKLSQVCGQNNQPTMEKKCLVLLSNKFSMSGESREAGERLKKLEAGGVQS